MHATAPSAAGVRPWGLTRMEPYPNPTTMPAYASVTIDPATQTGIYLDAAGQQVEMGNHGTATGSETSSQSTNLDGQGDTDSDQQNTDQD